MIFLKIINIIFYSIFLFHGFQNYYSVEKFSNQLSKQCSDQEANLLLNYEEQKRDWLNKIEFFQIKKNIKEQIEDIEFYSENKLHAFSLNEQVEYFQEVLKKFQKNISEKQETIQEDGKNEDSDQLINNMKLLSCFETLEKTFFNLNLVFLENTTVDTSYDTCLLENTTVDTSYDTCLLSLEEIIITSQELNITEEKLADEALQLKNFFTLLTAFFKKLERMDYFLNVVFQCIENFFKQEPTENFNLKVKSEITELRENNHILFIKIGLELFNMSNKQQISENIVDLYKEKKQVAIKNMTENNHVDIVVIDIIVWNFLTLCLFKLNEIDWQNNIFEDFDLTEENYENQTLQIKESHNDKIDIQGFMEYTTNKIERLDLKNEELLDQQKYYNQLLANEVSKFQNSQQEIMETKSLLEKEREKCSKFINSHAELEKSFTKLQDDLNKLQSNERESLVHKNYEEEKKKLVKKKQHYKVLFQETNALLESTKEEKSKIMETYKKLQCDLDKLNTSLLASQQKEMEYLNKVSDYEKSNKELLNERKQYEILYKKAQEQNENLRPQESSMVQSFLIEDDEDQMKTKGFFVTELQANNEHSTLFKSYAEATTTLEDVEQDLKKFAENNKLNNNEELTQIIMKISHFTSIKK